MTNEQIDFLKNMTDDQARAVLRKFKNDPYRAAAKSEAAITAFMRAFEQVNPGSYIQRADLAGGVTFSEICA